MPSSGPASYNADLALLDVEMAVKYGVLRENYEDVLELFSIKEFQKYLGNMH
jgi:hypothetical protein